MDKYLYMQINRHFSRLALLNFNLLNLCMGQYSKGTKKMELNVDISTLMYICEVNTMGYDPCNQLSP